MEEQMRKTSQKLCRTCRYSISTGGGLVCDYLAKAMMKEVGEGSSGCTSCYEEQRQCECEDWKSYMEIAEQMKEVGE